MSTTISKFRGYILNGEFFRTKDDVRDRVRGVLHSYPVGSRVDDEDRRFLFDLLQGHPDATNKIGCGIAGFEVRQAPQFVKERCFYLVRIDGSVDDFSYMKCLQHPTPLAVFKGICRKLVGNQMHVIKSMYFREYGDNDGRVRCPLTGQRVTQDQSHVDHIPPDTFSNIVSTFIAKNSIEINTVKLQEDTETCMGKTFSNASLIEDWVNYHKMNAKVRVISAYANLNIVGQKDRVLNKLSEQTDIAEIYELAPTQFEFLVELAMSCKDPMWREADRECLENFAERIVGSGAVNPMLRTTRHEAVLSAAIDWILSGGTEE